MPDAIRATVESFGAHPQRSGFRAAILAVCTVLGGLLPRATALAEGSLDLPPLRAAASPPHEATLEAYLAAFLTLDRHELAALALTLGIL
jgi:hypothetical protein